MSNQPTDALAHWQSEYPSAYSAIHSVATLYTADEPEYRNVDWSTDSHHGLIVLAFDEFHAPLLFHEAWKQFDLVQNNTGYTVDPTDWAEIDELLSAYGMRHGAVPYAVMIAPDDNPYVLRVHNQWVVEDILCIHGTLRNRCAECVQTTTNPNRPEFVLK